jgi:hypothetical protein
MTNDSRDEGKFARAEDQTTPEVSESSSKRWLYIGATAVMVLLSILILAYIGVETIQQADRRVEPLADKSSGVSENSRVFKNVLDRLKSGKSVESCMAELARIKDSENAKRMVLGLAAYANLKTHVDADDEIDYEQVREKISPFLNEVRTHYGISPDTLYFAFLARDIFLYIFEHDEVFLIHDSDLSILGKDESLKAFYTDSQTVYSLLKRIVKDQMNEEEAFRKDADNGNLFIVTMYCKARWATVGINDERMIDNVLQTINSESLSLTSQQGRWLDKLKENLEDAARGIFKTRVKADRPDFISTNWLR